MATVGVYCDGFNIYYGLRKHLRASGVCFYWLNIATFTSALARRQPYGSKTDAIGVVKYFTADPIDPARQARHQYYFDTIRGLGGVDIIDGRYSRKARSCILCNGIYQDFEEKETDVSLGLHVLCDAIDGRYDRLVLVSGDTDFVPVLRTVRQRAPQIELISAIPLGRYPSARLKNLADHQVRLKPSDYQPHRMPWNMSLPSGAVRSCPAPWRIP